MLVRSSRRASLFGREQSSGLLGTASHAQLSFWSIPPPRLNFVGARPVRTCPDGHGQAAPLPQAKNKVRAHRTHRRRRQTLSAEFQRQSVRGAGRPSRVHAPPPREFQSRRRRHTPPLQRRDLAGRSLRPHRHEVVCAGQVTRARAGQVILPTVQSAGAHPSGCGPQP